MTSTRVTQNPGKFQSLCLSHQIIKLCMDKYNLYLQKYLNSLKKNCSSCSQFHGFSNCGKRTITGWLTAVYREAAFIRSEK